MNENEEIKTVQKGGVGKNILIVGIIFILGISIGVAEIMVYNKLADKKESNNINESKDTIESQKDKGNDSGNSTNTIKEDQTSTKAYDYANLTGEYTASGEYTTSGTDLYLYENGSYWYNTKGGMQGHGHTGNYTINNNKITLHQTIIFGSDACAWTRESEENQEVTIIDASTLELVDGDDETIKITKQNKTLNNKELLEKINKYLINTTEFSHRDQC